jgi:hypothetical protein
MGSVYGTHGTADKYIQDLDEKTSRKTYGRKTLWTSGISRKSAGFIHLPLYGEQWWTPVNTGIHLLVPYNAQNFVIS